MVEADFAGLDRPDATTVSWVFEGRTISKKFVQPPRSAVFVDDPPSVVIVEPMNETMVVSNAVVYDLDGRERLRLDPPAIDRPIGFDQVFMSRAGLVAVFATRSGDFHGVPDLSTGILRDVREWR